MAGRSKRYMRYLSWVIIFVIALIFIILLVQSIASKTVVEKSDETEISPGVSFIQEREAMDTTIVETTLKELRQEKLQEQKDELMAQVESGEVDVWSLFEDYAIMGDSRGVGFYYFGYLPENRVLAYSGASILVLEEHIPDIVDLNPSYIICEYGVNDIGLGIWPTPEEYVTEYIRIIEEIRAELPDLTIYINSILPCCDPAFNTDSNWLKIPEYNVAIKEMCEENDLVYIDNDGLYDKYSEYWEVDGIHLQAPFYPYWASNMIMEVYNHELGEDEDTDS